MNPIWDAGLRYFSEYLNELTGVAVCEPKMAKGWVFVHMEESIKTSRGHIEIFIAGKTDTCAIKVCMLGRDETQMKELCSVDLNDPGSWDKIKKILEETIQ